LEEIGENWPPGVSLNPLGPPRGWKAPQPLVGRFKKGTKGGKQPAGKRRREPKGKGRKINPKRPRERAQTPGGPRVKGFWPTPQGIKIPGIIPGIFGG